MSSTSGQKAQPDKDPLEVLGLKLGASETDISKAYRQLARTLHPDKLDASADRDAAAERFQDIQTARAFLLDPEFLKAREKYYKQQTSDQLRRATQAAREAAQSAQRRRMRRELQEREVRTQPQPDRKDALQEEGRKLREQYATQQASVAANERTERQVRLKWSRKQLAAAGEPSPSEDSIAKQLGDLFGVVRDVLMIGSKGNVALVTFAHSSSCDAIVERFADSDCWRATYVNEEAKKRHEEKKKQGNASTHNQRDGESVLAWRERRDAQRESLLREMENGQEEAVSDEALPFPPAFPDHYEGSPLEMLEQAEASLLKDLVSADRLSKISFAKG